MHYFLFVTVRRFYASALEEQNAEMVEKALVVHANKKVLDVNDRASKSGVREGMRLSEAKALVHDGVFVLWEAGTYKEAQHRWLDLCTKYSDRIEPDEQHAAFVDLCDIADPASAAMRLLNDLAAGYRVLAAGSTVKWIAKAAARWKGVEGALIDATDATGFILPMPISSLSPVPVEHRARLRFLGYRTVGEVSTLPLQILRGQFGEQSMAIHQAANGGFHESIRAEYPPRSLIRRIRFDGSVSDHETFHAGIKELAGEISSALSLSDSQSRSAELVIAPEDGPPIRIARTFTKPIANFMSASTALALMASEALSKLDPEQPNPICWIRACLSPLEASERFQRCLQGPNGGPSSTDSALKGVRTAFGDSVLVMGSDVVQPRRKTVLKAWKDATGWV